MKKFVICLLALSFLTFVSCKKDDVDTPTQTTTDNNNNNNNENPPDNPPENPPSPADDFVGDYLLNGTLTLNIPTELASFLGDNQSQDITDREVSVERVGDNGDVSITMDGNSYEGYVNNSGLHIDPIIINYPLGQTSLTATLTIPVISKPVDGSTSCQATLIATVYGIAITGTADIVATRIE